MSSFRKGPDASSLFSPESPGSQSEHRLPPPPGHSKPKGTLERQDTLESVEYHSEMEDNREEEEEVKAEVKEEEEQEDKVKEEEEEEEEGMAMPTTNKRSSKKKRHFGIFQKSSRCKSKEKEKNKPIPTAGLMHTLSVPGETSPSSVRRTLSNTSISNETEGSVEHVETQSDQEFAETLMNPTPRASLLGRDSRMEDSSAEEVPAEREHIVYVTLHSGHHLAVRDRTGSSDPYVKFKCGRFKYRSAVIHRNLNPEWNESFSFKTTDLGDTPLTIRVYDYDFGSLDDFMGRTSVNLSPYLDGELHIVDLGLEDPVATIRGETLGSIRIFLQIMEGDLVTTMTDSPTAKQSTNLNKSQRSTKLWRSVLGVTLLEGISLPAMDDNGFSDPYCKFKLGSLKYKSKICQKTLNPEWKERFELRMYDGDCTTLHVEVWDKNFPQSDDFIGGCEVDLKSLEPEVTHDMKLPLKGVDRMDAGAIHVLLVVTGTSVEEEEDRDGREENAKDINMNEVRRRYALMRTIDLKAVKDVGFLRVKIQRAEGLPSLDTCAIVEVGNAAVRTKTVYKTANPKWNKTFCFNVKDVHDDLEVLVYSEVKNTTMKGEFIGKIKVPLLRLENGVSKMYVLKDRHCLQSAKGVVYLECELVYNPVRACIRTINPRETKLMDEEQKFKRKVLMNNIKRVMSLIRTLGDTWGFIKSLWSWENKAKSTAAFIIFLIVCLFGELWMFCAVGAFIFLNQYLLVYIRGKHDWQISQRRALSIHSSFEESNEDLSDLSDFTDLEDEVNSKQQDARKSLREKFRQIQEVLLIVQNLLGFLADLGERVKNLFDWSVPFLCWMAVSIFLLASILFYFMPLRYVILVWGINKFTKRLRKPNYIENNELLDFLSRSPTDRQLLEWREPYSRSGTAIKKRKKKRH